MSSSSEWAGFGIAVLLGAAGALGLLAAFTPLVVLIPLVAGGIVAVGRWPVGRRGWPGAIAGLGLPPLYVGYLNRDGPGPAG